jgi:hypothetical protein
VCVLVRTLIIAFSVIIGRLLEMDYVDIFFLTIGILFAVALVFSEKEKP